MKALNKIRAPHKGTSLNKKIIFSLLNALLGFALGVYSGFLERLPSDLPEIFYIFYMLFGRIVFWAFITMVIYVFSKTPFRAAINAFCIFAGMLIGYFIYSFFIAGFLPESSELIMYGALIVISPVVAVLCWYAKGRGTVSTIISAFIISYFISQTFSFAGDFSYFEITKQVSEIILLPASIVVLYRRPKQTIISVIAAAFISYFIVLLPFSIPFINS